MARPVFAGIDVGARRYHCVALDAERSFVGGAVFAVDELDRVLDWASGSACIAVDAPAGLSTMPHDDDLTLSPKFRAARCAEIALGRECGIWVPWVAPATRPRNDWFAAGLSLYECLHDHDGAKVIEVFPYAGFRVLAGGARLARKTTVRGVRERAELLAAAGIRARDLELWSHDSLDALVAAAIALAAAEGSARPVTCGHDGSAIWLPAPA